MATGILKTKVLIPKSFRNTYVVPDEVSVMQIKNIGLDAVMLWFDDEIVRESYSLSAGEILSEVAIKSRSTKINYQAVTNEYPKLQLIFWDR